MHIALFTEAIKDITAHAEEIGLPKHIPLELAFALSNGGSMTGTIDTFDMNGLIVIKTNLGQTVYVAAENVVTVSRIV
jgi:sRNA-binding regulator protein Hfq